VYVVCEAAPIEEELSYPRKKKESAFSSPFSLSQSQGEFMSFSPKLLNQTNL
jgi:hypothetical protein